MSTILGWVLLVVQILFGISAVAIFSEFKHNRQLRNLLASATFFLAAVASYYLVAWWPLFAGFGLLWAYKLMGLDPGDDYRTN